MSVQESITLLHLSDLQFGRHHRFGNLRDSDPDGDFDTLFGRLDQDLKKLEAEGVHPQLIIVSGDLAEWGMKSEFKDALDFLLRLAMRVEVPRSHVVIVPGNHDVNRKLCEAYFAECEGREEKPVEPYARKWEHYLWLFNEFYGKDKKDADIAFSPEEPWSFWKFDDLNLVVVGLNSTMAESHLDDAHYGWIGERQLRWFAQRLDLFVKNGWFRLGVVHHNVKRGADADDENLRDADQLEAVLGRSLNLLLHGHTHNAKIAWLRPGVPILSTGSAALKPVSLPAEVPNQYHAIRIGPKRLERWARRYEPDLQHWGGDTRCSEDGDRWHVEYEAPFDSVHGTFGTDERTDVADGPPDEVVGDRRRSKEVRERGDSFLDRVAEICSLRYSTADHAAMVEAIRDDSHLEYLRVRLADEHVVRVVPVGVAGSGISEELVESFRRKVFARYRAHDPSLTCEIVYSGDRASEDLIKSAARENVHLRSFLEFQGIIDFRGYIDRQTRTLERDVVYPPSLYVPQHLIYEIGREEHVSHNALNDVLEWLREPFDRFILVLGDFGTGKTFLLHELARRMPTEIPHLVPILIELHSLEKAHTVEQLVAQHLTAAGERYINLNAFPYMLREGRIALLFDGFDELAQRVTYERATAHFETLVQAVDGRAKVIVTSRTQHFESDRQVELALLERAQTVAGLYLSRLQRFDEEQIQSFLVNLLGDATAAQRRFDLIDDISDLLGLSQNPRMLSFIANLPEEQLREVKQRTGTISSAELYRLLVDRWLTYEYDRVQPEGAAPTLSVEERWRAVTALALRLWPKLEQTIRLRELTDEVARAIDSLTEGLESGALTEGLDRETAAHLVGSGTLLVRDEEGTFAFVHQSVMEWLVANHVAQQMVDDGMPAVLAQREMSPLMADFLCDLAGPDRAREWAATAVAQEGQSLAKTNALLVLSRLEEAIGSTASLEGQSLRGKDFSGQIMVETNLSSADLTEARLEDADLTGVDLTNAVLERADLARARLRRAKLTGIRAAGAGFLGADLREAMLDGADLRRAKLVGAQVTRGSLAGCSTFGFAPPEAREPEPMLSPASPCTSVAYGIDEIIASGHAQGTIHLWDADTGVELRVLRGQAGAIRGLVFSPDGARLASAGDEGTVQLWELEIGKELSVFGPHSRGIRGIAFSPDGGCLATADGEGNVRLWDLGAGAEPRLVLTRKGPIRDLVFSPDGARLTSVSWDTVVRLWDAKTGTELGVLSGPGEPINEVAFAPDGARLASAGRDRAVRLWDVNADRELRALAGHEEEVTSVAFSRDGALLASADRGGTIRLWDVEAGSELHLIDAHPVPISSLVFSPSGARLASVGWDGTIRLWEVETGNELRTLRGYGSRTVNGVAFSHNGLLVSGGGDGAVRVWKVGTNVELQSVLRSHENAVNGVALSPDGTLVVTASDDETVRVWDVANGTGPRVLRGPETALNGVAFSPEGALVAGAADDETVRVWDVETGNELHVLRGHDDWVRSVVFSPDGDRLASASDDATVRVWDVAAGIELHVLRGHDDWVRSVAFSPQGEHLASAGDDATVRVWDVATGNELRVLRGHRNWVRSVVFSPNGELIASAALDWTIRLWDVETGAELHVLNGHQGSVYDVSFSPDGSCLATASSDGSVRLWDTKRAELLLTIVAAAEGWAAFSPAGQYTLSGRLGGLFWYAIGLCRFEPGELDSFLPPGTLERYPSGD